MVVEKLKVIEVNTYNELFDLYEQGELGCVEQRMPENLKRFEPGEDGTDEELINSLLSMDTDNFYHVEFIDIRDGFFRITIIGFTILKFLSEKVIAINISFGEDGLWQEAQENEDDENWIDGSLLGVIELSGIEVELEHEITK
jgi:hypothetical protein